MSELHTGKKQFPETIAKRVVANTGQQRVPRKICTVCGSVYVATGKRRETAKFCSMECKGKWQSENAVGEKSYHWKGGGISKKCEECGKEFGVEKTRNDNARFCSRSCRGKWSSKNFIGENNPNWTGGSLTKICEECGNEFIVERTREKTARFCSFSCHGKWMSKNLVGENNPIYGKPGKNTKEKHWAWKGGEITINCEECGKEFKIKRSQRERTRRNFCSRICRGQWLSKNIFGENHPSWIGGPKDYCEKWSLELRRRIRAFFNDECVECGTLQKKPLLHCHHVYYDKKACCSIIEDGRYFSNLGIKDNPHSFEIVGDPNKFVALCDNCHKKTSGKKNRAYWARHFEEIINNYYLGKSYFTKEEYEKIR